jgi:CelD/BcsL family acetyltransferase involved in cellulose biosynthesis
LKLYTLWVGTTPAAAFYCLEHGSDICYYLGGFDTSLAKFRPLKGLMGHAIQDAIGNGRELLDFLKGEEQYKTEWRAENRSTYRVLLAPAGVRQWFVMSSLKLQPKVKDMQRRRRQRAVTQHTAEDSTEE